MPEQFVILGAGQAAQSALEAARAAGFAGPITMIGDEPARPYQRPPLSKAYLLGDMARERLFFRPEAYYAERDATLRLGVAATAIDPATRRVALSDGETLAYDRLLIATGARARRLPEAIGGALRGVFTVRTLADIDALRPMAAPGKRAVIVGGGYIGLEAAAALRKLGLEIVVVEREARILARVACAATADYFTTRHEAAGVRVLTGASLARFEPGAGGAVAAAVLESGERLEADFAIVGVGVIPNAELAAEAGLDVDDGIVVDDHGRTSDPAIFAAGDVARIPWKGRRIRLESVQNAIDLGAVAGRAMVDRAAPAYDPKPWFWSDQYDVKLQIAGLGDGATDWIVRPGARDGAQSVWYFDAEERLLAVDAMNDARAYLVGKKLLETGRTVAKSVVADPDADLKALL